MAILEPGIMSNLDLQVFAAFFYTGVLEFSGKQRV